MRRQTSDVTVQPSSEEEEEEEDDEEDEDEEWAWRSAGGDLTKRYNRMGLNCQVGLDHQLIIDYRLFSQLTVALCFYWSVQQTESVQ